MKYQIKSRHDEKVLYEGEGETLREVVAAADAMREQFRPNTVNLIVHEYDAARAAVGEV